VARSSVSPQRAQRRSGLPRPVARPTCRQLAAREQAPLKRPLSTKLSGGALAESAGAICQVVVCGAARLTTCHRASMVSADRSAPQSHSTK